VGNSNCCDGEPIGYCVPSYMSDPVYSIYCIIYFRVLVYVISVIMMEYTIQYRELCCVVNRIWHTLCRVV
jgi:hypothetical protein